MKDAFEFTIESVPFNTEEGQAELEKYRTAKKSFATFDVEGTLHIAKFGASFTPVVKTEGA